MKKIKEWFSIRMAKNPGALILEAILLFNVIFVLLGALAISYFSKDTSKPIGYIEGLFYTIAMIFDAGSINYVVDNFAATEAIVTFVCVAITFLGMLLFTGAVIGYITNMISNIISNANTGRGKLFLHNHVVILNWNSRASEIINDLLYVKTRQKVVVLTDSRKPEIEKEISERLEDTISKENSMLKKEIAKKKEEKRLNFISGYFYYLRNKLSKRKVIYVVKEGDIFSSKQLADISLSQARMIIILESDFENVDCKYALKEQIENSGKGNTQTVKTLMQVANITASEDSADDQKIIVEITDQRTSDLVDKIISAKTSNDLAKAKCKIVPISTNKILGQLLSQFAIMPELNEVYRELFSNKGCAFYTKEFTEDELPMLNKEKHLVDEDKFILDYMKVHRHAIPLRIKYLDGKYLATFTASSNKDINNSCLEVKNSDHVFEFNKDFGMQTKSVVIFGHNSKIQNIMEGFKSFTDEWGLKTNKGDDTLRINVMDSQKNLDAMKNYVDYPFVIRTSALDDINENEIRVNMDNIIRESKHRVSLLFLSDDNVSTDYIDANVLSNIIYEQKLIHDKKSSETFDADKFNIVAEIIDPKHYDLVNNYLINNIVITNRYISKMMTQIGEKKEIFDFYTDILTYDEAGAEVFESKEIYAKQVKDLFVKFPKTSISVKDLIRGVFKASIDEELGEKEKNPTIVIGYIRVENKKSTVRLFVGDQATKGEDNVILHPNDKLIVYSNH